jgi:preprotein translocase subunit YajC
MLLPLLIALATTITPTQTPLPTPTTTTDEIQKIREVVQQKVMEKLKQITNPVNTNKGIIGKVIQISPDQITIEYQNNVRNLNIGGTTVYIDVNRNKTKLGNVKIGQDILAMGISNNETNAFDARRIVFIDLKTIDIPKTVTIGKIVDLSKTSPIFTLIPSKNKNSLFQIKTDAKTVIFDKNQIKIKLTDLKSGQKIITILTPDLKMSKTYYALEIINLDYQPPISPTPTPKN